MTTTYFYAYPSNPPSLVYNLTQAIGKINSVNKTIQIRSWESYSVNGTFIIQTICAAIDECDEFLCDLTYINPNVLFELGYAIASEKKIWISIDDSQFDGERVYDELRILTTIGHGKYQNSDDLVKAFMRDNYSDARKGKESVFSVFLNSLSRKPVGEPSLLYLKCQLATEESNELTRVLSEQGYPLVTDDKLEIPHRSFEWYMETIERSFAVVAHFLDTKRDAKSPQNAKYALLCGLAHGLGKPLLMLAHSPYRPPIDYRDLIAVHETGADCAKLTRDWLNKRNNKYLKAQSEYTKAQKKLRKTASELKSVKLGEYLAEDEATSLSHYFVETPVYTGTFSVAQYSILVGRKGSGKTALLYKIQEVLTDDETCHVCIVKPVDYELEGILDLYGLEISFGEKTYLIESLWKFLILTELAMSATQMLESKLPSKLTQADVDFLKYIKNIGDYIEGDFTVRLEHTIARLRKLEPNASIEEQRQKFNEALHENIIGQLRQFLGQVLKDKRVYVLVDNLDKVWNRDTDLKRLSEFLFGLLNAVPAIASSFAKSTSRDPYVDMKLLVFIRSDIFRVIQSHAREKDKLKATRIDWNEPELLLRVIENRFIDSLHDKTNEEIWTTFFVEKVKQVNVKDYLLARVIARPRDLIFFCKQALSRAIALSHVRIEEDDILAAEKEYSEHVYYSLLAEIEAEIESAEQLIIEFAGTTEVLARSELEAIFNRANIPMLAYESTINTLVDATFLGIEIDEDQFEFIYNVSRKPIIKQLALRTREKTGIERYKINLPFHSHLSIHVNKG